MCRLAFLQDLRRRFLSFERGGLLDITVVIKIAAVGILVAILNSILSRSGRDDYAMIVALAGIAAVLMMLIPQLVTLLESAGAILDF